MHGAAGVTLNQFGRTKDAQMSAFVAAWNGSETVPEVADKLKLSAAVVKSRADHHRARGVQLKRLLAPAVAESRRGVGRFAEAWNAAGSLAEAAAALGTTPGRASRRASVLRKGASASRCSRRARRPTSRIGLHPGVNALTVTHIDHVSVIITDTARSRAFYGGVLRLREIPKPKTFDFVALWYDLGGGHTLHLLLKPEADNLSPRHFCLRVTNARAAREHFNRLGIPIQETGPIPGADRFFVSDPDGNRVEVLQWLTPYDPSVSGAAALDP
jgi:catechol 2,3-dioxygenase-like lactoylglutathione lyase family enzyme